MFRFKRKRDGTFCRVVKSTRASFSAMCFFDEKWPHWGWVFHFLPTQLFPTWAIRCCRENNAAHDFTWLYIRNNKTRNVYEAQPKHSILLSHNIQHTMKIKKIRHWTLQSGRRLTPGFFSNAASNKASISSSMFDFFFLSLVACQITNWIGKKNLF